MHLRDTELPACDTIPGRTEEIWSPQQAWAWANRVGWLVGCNFTPSSAGNQLEMWQPDTFDPQTIDRELSWAAHAGMNSVRIFLHDLAWAEGGDGFLDRVERFLDIAERHGIGVMPVIFESVWHPFPRSGRQREPEPGVHNSMWLQSPGVATLRDPSAFARLETYVRRVVARFRDDQRIHLWDLWNEPDNHNLHSYGPRDLGPGKAEVVAPLLSLTSQWVRVESPSQPLSTAIWLGNWSSPQTLTAMERLQLELSDVVTFHCYAPPDELARRIGQLQRYGRPMLCTEFMARAAGSTMEGCLPVLRQHQVGGYCWGLVRGRTQTHFPWDSWQKPYHADPEPWFHELFHPDGRPYRPQELQTLRLLTGKA